MLIRSSVYISIDCRTKFLIKWICSNEAQVSRQSQHDAKSICSLSLFNELDLRWCFLCFYWKLNALLTANALVCPNGSPLLFGTALFCLASLRCGYLVLPVAQNLPVLPSTLMQGTVHQQCQSSLLHWLFFPAVKHAPFFYGVPTQVCFLRPNPKSIRFNRNLFLMSQFISGYFVCIYKGVRIAFENLPSPWWL